MKMHLIFVYSFVPAGARMNRGKGVYRTEVTSSASKTDLPNFHIFVKAH